MPLDRVDQLPLPNLYWYAGSSGLVLFYAVVYALTAQEGLTTTLSSDIWCTAAVLNMACCLFFLLTKSIHSFVFGPLHKTEQHHMRDKFWNFVFYKFIFVFGVMNVQEMQEMLCWFVWFAVLGTLFLTEQLCKDRFQFLSYSPKTPASSHAKIIILLSAIVLCCAGLVMVSAIVGWQFGFNHFTFLYSEVFILFAKTLHTIIRYIIHLWDIHHDGNWENQSTYTYYVELVLEVAALCVDFVHHVHMLLWANMFLSVASLILLMKLRFLYQEIQRRLKKHRKYITVSQTVEKRYLRVSMADETCAICWEMMKSARQLPCGHIFHMSCLISWLEQDTVCPTCRHSLSDDLRPSEEGREVEHQTGTRGERRLRRRGRNARRRNWLLHFNGASIATWFPSFSIQLHRDDDLRTEADTIFPEALTLDLADAHSISLSVDQALNRYTPGHESDSEIPPSQNTSISPPATQVGSISQDDGSPQNLSNEPSSLTPSPSSPITSFPATSLTPSPSTPPTSSPLIPTQTEDSGLPDLPSQDNDVNNDNDGSQRQNETVISHEHDSSVTDDTSENTLRRRRHPSNTELKSSESENTGERDNVDHGPIPIVSSIRKSEGDGIEDHHKPEMVSSDEQMLFASLQQRKEQLLEKARRQYLQREHNTSSD